MTSVWIWILKPVYESKDPDPYQNVTDQKHGNLDSWIKRAFPADSWPCTTCGFSILALKVHLGKWAAVPFFSLTLEKYNKDHSPLQIPYQDVYLANLIIICTLNCTSSVSSGPFYIDILHLMLPSMCPTDQQAQLCPQNVPAQLDPLQYNNGTDCTTLKTGYPRVTRLTVQCP